MCHDRGRGPRWKRMPVSSWWESICTVAGIPKSLRQEFLHSMRHSRDMLTDRSTYTESRRTLEAALLTTAGALLMRLPGQVLHATKPSVLASA